MTSRSLHNPFDPQHALSHTASGASDTAPNDAELDTHEARMARAVESSVVRAIFGGNDMARRRFLQVVGAGAAAEIIRTAFPLDAAKAMAAEQVKGIEKRDLQVGFIPITCATPIIMAEPMGFYAKHGLNAKVRRAAGWAMVRDWAINKEVDAAHMLSPMPLSITLGAGSQKVPYFMPAVENINGQAITLHKKYKDVKTAQDMKGFRFCVPFRYSMHNYLLRYFLAEGGIHPDQDVQIRVVPPPEMVANLKAENVDGYLAPDPFNQRAVYENAGFIYKLSKDIWPGIPAAPSPSRRNSPRRIPTPFWPFSSRLSTPPTLPRNRKPQGNRQIHRAPKLPQPARDRVGAGVDRQIRGRPRRHFRMSRIASISIPSRGIPWRCGY